MPLGDPGGGSFTYAGEGLPESLFMAAVCSSDVRRSIEFYNGILGMDVVFREDSEAVVKRGSAVVLIKKGSVFGDSGIFFGVNDPYALHRRLIDEGVVFVRDPTRGPMGVFTSFLDPDGNTLHAIGIESPRP